MANIKSQIKRNRQNEKRRLRNRYFRGAARTAVSRAHTAMESGSPETREAVLKAISALDRAAERGVLHPNNAARRKGRLMKRLARLNTAPLKAEEPKAAETESGVEESKAKKPAARKKTSSK